MRLSKVIWTSRIKVPEGMQSIRDDVLKISTIVLHVFNEHVSQLHAILVRRKYLLMDSPAYFSASQPRLEVAVIP